MNFLPAAIFAVGFAAVLQWDENHCREHHKPSTDNTGMWLIGTIVFIILGFFS